MKEIYEWLQYLKESENIKLFIVIYDRILN